MALVEKELKRILPKVRGRYLFNVPLAPTTWFRVGGAAQVTFKPADIQDLAFFLQNRPSNLPLHVIGVGSNILVRDGGIQGVVIRLGQGFTNLFVDEPQLDAGAAVLDRTIATVSAEAAITGFEFLCGIPGTVGGALRMIAGAYGSVLSHVLVYSQVMESQGTLHQLSAQELGLSYRHCDLSKEWIFIGARFKGEKGDSKMIQKKISSYLEERERTQPVKTQTGGSTFANPPHEKAWQLIEKAGCRGLKKGGAMISELHCNFMINTGNATATDLEELGEEVRHRVLEKTGVDLRWEIERMGIAKSSQVGERAA